MASRYESDLIDDVIETKCCCGNDIELICKKYTGYRYWTNSNEALGSMVCQRFADPIAFGILRLTYHQSFSEGTAARSLVCKLRSKSLSSICHQHPMVKDGSESGELILSWSAKAGSHDLSLPPSIWRDCQILLCLLSKLHFSRVRQVTVDFKHSMNALSKWP